MSAISDYGSLLIDAGEYSGRDDVAHLFPRFVALAEAKFNRVLRVGDMETSGTVVLTDGDAALPDDFLAARMVLGPAGQQLNAWSASELNRRYGNFGGYPSAYSVVGNTLRVRPTSAGNVLLDYYAKIPPLSALTPTNWLLEKAPDVYLYALVEEIAIWAKDLEKAVTARSMKEDAMLGLSLADESARWGNGQVVIGGLTP